ncbi:MAG: dihydrolipoyllysine-residue acetyltransferase [Gammaproteobacteria bacterium]|nr:dihydrolipoyllysine-residue acetyltransferase [Gammaproteobacteria bacterium]
MSKDFILPDIGEGIVECEVVEWLVKEGDEIKEDQPICDVMTDKALVQIPAVSDGIVSKIYYQKGEIAKVHEPLFALSSSTEGNVENSPTQAVTDQILDRSPVKDTPLSTGGMQLQIEDFLLPDIGEGIVECEVVEWLVAEGDDVKEDQAICDVMTDKALVQIPAKSDGKIEKLYYEKGEIAKVHEPLFALSVVTQQNTTAKAKRQADVSKVEKVETASVQSTENQQSVESSARKKAVASPAVRRLAREMNIDITQVKGSGEKGRVFKDDLRNHNSQTVNIESQASKPVSQASVNTTAQNDSSNKVDHVEPIKGVKAAMANAMQASVSTIPHFTYTDEIDLTELYEIRKQLKPQYEEQGIKLTMMSFFIKALSLALKEFPIMNSTPNAECTELTYLSEHNIGMAVDSKVGLLVPNVKSCQNKSIKHIAQEVAEITNQARAGRLMPEQMKGGTITISNIGAIGGISATPIINKPEVAIVALGKLQELPRFNAEGSVEARRIMTVSWSGDHRIIDGGTIARFNNLWCSYLQNPSSMLMNLV